MSPASIDGQRSEELATAWARAYGGGHSPAQLQDPIATAIKYSRSEADALAAWRRWHDPCQEAHFSSREWCWFALFERARVETLARRHLDGMSSNLNQPATTAPADNDKARLYQVARNVFAGDHDHISILEKPSPVAKTGSPLRGHLRTLWRNALAPRAKLPSAENSLDDSDILAGLTAASAFLDDPDSFAESLTPLVQRLTVHHAEKVQDQLRLLSIHADASPEGDAIEDMEGAHTARKRMSEEKAERDDRRHDYAVYSRAWDEEQVASYWYSSEDAAALKSLDLLDRRRVRQLARRLQRRLMATRLRQWSFDQDEGRLDSRRLARLIGEPHSQRIFRIENEAPVPEACVTLLVDQSGSMRGRRRQMAATAIDLAVHTLEICRIRCEVLGFTTRFNANNPPAQQWQIFGARDTPGRLNALRHIIYKTAEQPWRAARPQLGLLLRDEFGHENIDGEALYWAARRLMRQPQPRKILIVLSDGAPYDKATAQANGREFLERHLRVVIGEIERSPITLAAIGTGQDVARFYRHALTVRRPEAVADSLFESLGELLTPAIPSESQL